MKQVIPYTSYHEAIEALDNGGKFYNLFCHAHDGVVTPAELGRVAGVVSDRQALILYLVLSISRLDNRSREKVLAHLDSELFECYEKYKPQPLSLNQFLEQGKPGVSATIVGTPRKVDTDATLGENILVPIVVGAVTSFTMVPISNSYEVYELQEEGSSASILVAHHNEKDSLPERKLRIGGMITTLSQSQDSTHSSDRVFLEAQFYLEED